MYRRYRQAVPRKRRLTDSRCHLVAFLGNYGSVSRYSTNSSSFDPTHTWVIDGGPNLPSLPNIEPPTLVIAADVGYLHAQKLGIQVDVVVGDLDSLDRQDLDLMNSQIVVEQHPEDKDESDLALALNFARSVGATDINIITGGGGRLDHLLVSSMLLASEENVDQRIVTHCGSSRVIALKPGKRFDFADVTGSQISLIALTSDSRITTLGLRWNLSPSDPFPIFSTLGLSNEIVDPPTIKVDEGVFLVIVTSRDL